MLAYTLYDRIAFEEIFMGDRAHAVKASLEIVRKLGQGDVQSHGFYYKEIIIRFGIERDEQEEYESHFVKFKKSDKYIYFL